MRSKLLISAAIAASMSAMPVLANPASSLSLKGAAQVRAATATNGKASRLTGGEWVAAALAVAIVAGGVIIAVDDDNSDSR